MNEDKINSLWNCFQRMNQNEFYIFIVNFELAKPIHNRILEFPKDSKFKDGFRIKFNSESGNFEFNYSDWNNCLITFKDFNIFKSILIKPDLSAIDLFNKYLSIPGSIIRLESSSGHVLNTTDPIINTNFNIWDIY